MTQDAPRLGILMLDTKFPRIRGDVANPETWAFPIRLKVVAGATPEAIVCDDPEPFVRAFIDAGRDLIDEGCTGIATTCGFLSLIRPRLVHELGVPVAASALEQAVMIRPMLGTEQVIGVLTISASSLTRAHLNVAGVPPDSVVAGVDHTQFAQRILENLTTFDTGLARRELTKAAQLMVADRPDIGAILLECTNMPPYADAIAAAVKRPVFSIVSYLNWFHEGLVPSSFPVD